MRVSKKAAHVPQPSSQRRSADEKFVLVSVQNNTGQAGAEHSLARQETFIASERIADSQSNTKSQIFGQNKLPDKNSGGAISPVLAIPTFCKRFFCLLDITYKEKANTTTYTGRI